MDEKQVVQEEQPKKLTLEDVIASLQEAGIEDVDGALKGLYEELKARFEQNQAKTEDEEIKEIFG